MEPKLKNGAKNKTKNKKSVDMQHFFQYGERVRERILSSCLEWHCVKNVRIQSYSGPHFPAFGMSTGRYSVSLRIQSKFGKMRNRITPNKNIFHAANAAIITFYHTF